CHTHQATPIESVVKKIESHHWCRCFSFFIYFIYLFDLSMVYKIISISIYIAGSTGKGTTLDMSSDVDLVIFFSCFSSFQDQVEKREHVIKEIEKNLNRCIQTIAFKVDISPPRKKGTRSLQLHIQAKKKKELVEVDLLPAYDALGQITFSYVPPTKIYTELIEANGQPGEFNTSFTELQRNFVKRCPAKLKDLLRLVKHWYKEIKSFKLPPKFALELLTIYAWEEGTGKEQFNTAEGFCTVMKLITQYQHLCLYWTKYYNLDNSQVGLHVKGKLKESRPVIIDPADPTANVAKANMGAWDLLAQKASDCLTQPCCMKDEQPIEPWNVQVVCICHFLSNRQLKKKIHNF
uniref:2'-5' oligoadenylate synthase n=1 Tax=Pseudonaja textilis TaxID=8673 RepID=A0A670YIP3_PSETE